MHGLIHHTKKPGLSPVAMNGMGVMWSEVCGGTITLATVWWVKETGIQETKRTEMGLI